MGFRALGLVLELAELARRRAVLGESQERRAGHGPEEQRVRGGEGRLHRRRSADRVGPQELGREEVRGLGQAPVGERHVRVRLLQLALERQQEGAVPGEEGGVAVALVGPERGVELALGREVVDLDVPGVAVAPLVQVGERLEEAVALVVGQRARVLPDAHHGRMRVEQRPVGRAQVDLDDRVLVARARAAELAGDHEVAEGAVRGERQAERLLGRGLTRLDRLGEQQLAVERQAGAVVGQHHEDVPLVATGHLADASRRRRPGQVVVVRRGVADLDLDTADRRVLRQGGRRSEPGDEEHEGAGQGAGAERELRKVDDVDGRGSGGSRSSHGFPPAGEAPPDGPRPAVFLALNTWVSGKSGRRGRYVSRRRRGENGAGSGAQRRSAHLG